MRKLLTALVALVSLGLSLAAHAELAPGKTTVLITGANRGIGLEYVRQLSERGWNVIATARKPAEASELQALAARHPGLVIEALGV